MSGGFGEERELSIYAPSPEDLLAFTAVSIYN